MLTLVTSGAGTRETQQRQAQQRAPEAPPAPLELVAAQVDQPTDTVPVRSGRWQHVMRHGVFAEFGCTHCARSYERAMVRYSA